MAEMKPFDIVGLGASTIDVVARVEHLPGLDEVQRAMDITTPGGGPVATAMVTLARLGARTAMIDALGDDWRGLLARAEFEREGVNVDYLVTRPGMESPTACILVDRATGARSIVYSYGSAPEIAPGELPVAAIETARFLHLNGRHWPACLEAARIARVTGVLVSFDGGAGRHRPELDQLLPLVDVCIVAADFAARHTGERDSRRAAEALLRLGARIAAVTRGEEGSWIRSRDGEDLHQPAFRFAEIVDTTGCGDSYHGAFLFGLLRGMPLAKTAALASAVAGLNTQRLGGRAGLPTLGQALEFLIERGETPR